MKKLNWFVKHQEKMLHCICMPEALSWTCFLSHEKDIFLPIIGTVKLNFRFQQSC